MTYTTLILTLMMATFPLSAIARDVKGIDCFKLQAQGYKVACPDKAPHDDAELDPYFQTNDAAATVSEDSAPVDAMGNPNPESSDDP